MGDAVNEGVLIVELKEPVYSDQIIHLIIKGKDIQTDQGITIRTKTQSGYLDQLYCNGEGIPGSLYVSGYLQAGKQDAGSIAISVFSLFIVAFILWGIVYMILNRLVCICKLKAVKHKEQKVFKPAEFQHISKKSCLTLFTIIIIQLMVLEFGYYAGVKNSVNECVEPVGKPAPEYISIAPGEEIAMKASAVYFELSGVGMALKTESNYNDQVIELSISEESSADNENIYSVVYSIEDLIPNKKNNNRDFYFPKRISNSLNKEYIIRVRYVSGDGNLLFAVSDEDSTIPYHCEIYGARRFILKLYIGICVLLLLTTCILWYWKNTSKDWTCSAELIIVVLGMCFAVLIKPLSAPDEHIHFDEAYKISNQLLGIRSSQIPEAVYKRSEDTVTDILGKEKMTIDAYEWLKEKVKAEYRTWPIRYDADLQTVYARQSGRKTPLLGYFTAAVGITLARLIGLGYIGSFYLGRLFNFSIALLMIHYAIKKAPFGKVVYAVLSMMPVTLMVTTSLSYDAIIIPVCFCVAALAMRIVLAPGQVHNNELFSLGVLTAILVVLKSGGYLPVGLLSAVALFRYVTLIRSRSETVIKRLSHKTIGIAITLVLLVGILFLIVINRNKLIGIINYKQNVFSNRRETSIYSLSYLLRHPGQLFRIMEGTLFWRTQIMLDVTGAAVGWIYHITLNGVIRTFSVVLLAATCICENSIESIPKYIKRTCLLAFLISVTGFHYAMLVGWTTYGQNYVEGTQARYFIPVLPLLLFALQTKSIKRDVHSDIQFTYVGYALGILDIVSFVNITLG